MGTCLNAATAVELAIKLQQSLSVAPIDMAGRRLSFRIGTHLGEVFVELTPCAEDISGQAVIFAARLMGVARPDEIVVSETVPRSLTKGRSELLGPTEYHEFKGFLAQLGLAVSLQ